MPATNATTAVPANTWTQLTTSDVTALRLQHSGARIWIMATVGAVPPAGSPSGMASIAVDPLRILATDVTLAMLWPGVTGATRVYAFCDVPNAVSVSHA